MPSTAAEPPGGPDARPPLFVAAPGELAGDVVMLSGAEGRHAATVRRLAPGERVDVTDGAGQLAECVVTQARPGVLRLAVQARRVQPSAAPALVVVQALAKGDRGQLAVELLTETGADVIVPWAAQRSVTRWQGERGERALARWRATAQEAAKQARRARFPVVTPLADGPGVARLVRSAALDILNQEFVLALRAKGLAGRRVFTHVVKNAAPQIFTVLGLQFGFQLGGSVLVEAVFSWPGTGYLLNLAIFQRDIPVLQGVILVLATFFVLLNLVVDLLQTLVDPRIARH